MSDVKLFKLHGGNVLEVPGSAMQVEKSLQTLIEANLESFLGVRFLATEHSTGPVHGGRIDTLGIDEDGCPVIIEFKRALNENVVSQGLYYLDWLMDHKKEFQWLTMEALGPEVAKTVDWSAPRLLCIAGDFTRYDEHAVKQINRNIELLRYRRFGDDLLMLELVHAPKTARITSTASSPVPSAQPADAQTTDPYTSQRIAYRVQNSPPDIKDLYQAVSDYLTSLGDDVQVKELKNYVAFKRIKNFVCLEVYPQARVVTAYLKVDPSTVPTENGFSRDVTQIGHFGTGDLELSMRSMDDFAKAQPLLQRAYEGG